jgi:purple acid phosphatase-like protein/calcineurin-like phosphoesterase family protein/PEP-CTERM motif-containing protein
MKTTSSSRRITTQAGRAAIAALLGLAGVAAGQVNNVHTTFSGDPTSEVTVSWRTPPWGGTSLEYGLDPSLGSTASGTSLLSSGGFQHHVPLTGLQPDTTYYYRPTGGPLGSFRTAPADNRHFRFGVVGDVQGRVISQKWIDASNFLAEKDVLFWTPLGDLVQEGIDQSQYDAFWGGCTTLSQSSVCMPIIGNHDRYDLEWNAIKPQNYLDQFRLPSNGNVDYEGVWYEFGIGDSHFTALDSYPPGGPLTSAEARAVEAQWMDDHMAVSDAKWEFVSIHPPFYSTGGHGGENLASDLSSIFEAHGANAVFTGHVHSFEVTYPIHDGELADSWADGTLYYNSAGIGNSAVPGAWFSEFWQSEDNIPLVGVVDVYPDEIVVTTYDYLDGSIFHQVTISVAEALPGDANGDGAVTDADYTIWADNYGAADASWDMGDFNGDGEVTDADYTIWADNYGATDGNVPEPTSLGLLGVGAFALIRRRRTP